MHPVRAFGAPLRKLDTMSRGKLGKPLEIDLLAVSLFAGWFIFIVTAVVSATFDLEKQGLSVHPGTACHLPTPPQIKWFYSIQVRAATATVICFWFLAGK
jgi:hypothetical protein